MMRRAVEGLLVGLIGLFVVGTPRVYAVAVYDLSFNGAEVLGVQGEIFRENDIGPTGSGVLQPFVRLGASGIEQGYNTTGRPVPFDEDTSPFTHDLLLSAVPIFNVNGTLYREFVLDINESSGGSNALLSLDVVQIYLSNTPSQTTTTVSSLGSPVYDLDAGGIDRFVKLDYSLNSGSGSGDMRLFVPDSLFSTSYTYVYL